MMATHAAFVPGRISFEEYLEVCDGIRAEWVDGEVVEFDPALDRHADLSDFLISILRVLVEETGAGIVRSSQVAMRMGSVARVPDLLFLRTEHASRLTPTHVQGPADLVIEIVSPESRDRDRRQKLREYDLAGVEEYWIIDPMRESVEMHRRGSLGRYETVEAAGGKVESAVLPGFWIDPQWLWSSPMPDPVDVFREWGLI
jgi:Uma2 family endonuclease